jgi:hypothetical protein
LCTFMVGHWWRSPKCITRWPDVDTHNDSYPQVKQHFHTRCRPPQGQTRVKSANICSTVDNPKPFDPHRQWHTGTRRIVSVDSCCVFYSRLISLSCEKFSESFEKFS